MTYILIIAAVLLVQLYVVVPIRLRSKFWVPVEPVVWSAAIDDPRMPPAARTFFGTVTPELSSLGFVPAAAAIYDQHATKTTLYLAGFAKYPAGDSVTATACFTQAPGGRTVQAYNVEFCTRFADGHKVETNNSDHLPPFRHRSNQARQFPRLAEINRLYHIHQLLSARQGGAVKPLPTGSDYCTRVRGEVVEYYQKQVDAGFCQLNPDGTRYRYTWKGAALFVWGMLWPIGPIRRWCRARRVRQLLRELGLPAAYARLNYPPTVAEEEAWLPMQPAPGPGTSGRQPARPAVSAFSPSSERPPGPMVTPVFTESAAWSAPSQNQDAGGATAFGAPEPPMAEPLRHSTLGIVSFVIAAVTIVVDVVLVAVAVAMVIPSRGRGAMPPAFPVVVVLLMGTLLSNLAGAALGLAAVLQQHRKRILGALGLALNILLPAGVVVLWALGR